MYGFQRGIQQLNPGVNHNGRQRFFLAPYCTVEPPTLKAIRPGHSALRCRRKSCGTQAWPGQSAHAAVCRDLLRSRRGAPCAAAPPPAPPHRPRRPPPPLRPPALLRAPPATAT
eukprot:gene3802-biopygen14352